jgi:prolyl oligopeptidase
MRRLSCLAAAAAFALFASADGPSYPKARRADHVDTYHGVAVSDPYRWLEDTDSAETKAWIEAQNELTFGWLRAIPARKAIAERLRHLWNHERFGVPVQEGGRYFYTRNDGLQNQNVLLTAESRGAEPRVLLDPNTLSADGTVALTGWSPSRDGKLLAYGLAEAGSDWQVWRVRDVATGQDLPDEIRWVKFTSASWTPDGKGFYYSRFDEPRPGLALKDQTRFEKVYHHVLGTPQSQDRLVYERRDRPDWYLRGFVTDDGRFLVVSASEGSTSKSGLFYQDLLRPEAGVVELIASFDADYDLVDSDGRTFWVRTDAGGPRGRVVAVHLDRPARKDWVEVIPEAAEALQNVSVVGERFIASYLKDARQLVRLFDLQGRPQGEVALPGPGSAGGFRGKRGDLETFYSFTSYTAPGTVYRYDLKSGRSEVFRQPRVDFPLSDYETTQAFCTSKDGTRVGLFLTHRKGLRLDGSNPTVLYGYGGFNISQTPSFSASTLAWLERGGLYVVANLRGGGEYGEAWHEAGTKARKQNVFDDFIAAAEWLIAQRYTKPARLAIRGGSNGGLLVGAVMNQRPDLFAAALPAVGVMDMLRFHKFTVGWGWVGDYGSSDDPAVFPALRAYSPYHNLKPGTCHPATLVTTADHDDRVFPAHSFKYAAALQQAQACDRPTLIRIETRAGHGGQTPTSKRIEEAADAWAFLVKALGME